MNEPVVSMWEGVGDEVRLLLEENSAQAARLMAAEREIAEQAAELCMLRQHVSELTCRLEEARSGKVAQLLRQSNRISNARSEVACYTEGTIGAMVLDKIKELRLGEFRTGVLAEALFMPSSDISKVLYRLRGDGMVEWADDSRHLHRRTDKPYTTRPYRARQKKKKKG